MRYILVWQIFIFDHANHYVGVLSDQSEIQLNLESCRLAQRELYIITGMRGGCMPAAQESPRFEAGTVSRFMLGEKHQGRWISRYVR